jgi:hypothetical protein
VEQISTQLPPDAGLRASLRLTETAGANAFSSTAKTAIQLEKMGRERFSIKLIGLFYPSK